MKVSFLVEKVITSYFSAEKRQNKRMKLLKTSLLALVAAKNKNQTLVSEQTYNNLPAGHPLLRLESLNQEVEAILRQWFTKGAKPVTD